MALTADQVNRAKANLESFNRLLANSTTVEAEVLCKELKLFKAELGFSQQLLDRYYSLLR